MTLTAFCRLACASGDENTSSILSWTAIGLAVVREPSNDLFANIQYTYKNDINYMSGGLVLSRLHTINLWR